MPGSRVRSAVWGKAGNEGWRGLPTQRPEETDAQQRVPRRPRGSAQGHRSLNGARSRRGRAWAALSLHPCSTCVDLGLDKDCGERGVGRVQRWKASLPLLRLWGGGKPSRSNLQGGLRTGTFLCSIWGGPGAGSAGWGRWLGREGQTDTGTSRAGGNGPACCFGKMGQRRRGAVMIARGTRVFVAVCGVCF